MARFGPEAFELKDKRIVVLRHCSPDDAELFMTFQPQAATETSFTLQVPGRIPPIEKVRENWAQSEEDPLELRVGAFYDGRLVGVIGIHPPTPPHPWTRHCASFGMMLLKEVWGQGLGPKLLECIERHARKVGVTRIEALVRARNDRGIALYKKAGYDIEGTRRRAACIDGEFHDEYFIAKLM